MDPITTAVVAALAAGVTQGSVADAYNFVKQLIKTNFDNNVIEVIESLEKEPDSDIGKKWLQEKVQTNHLDKDTDIIEAAKKLMDEIEKSSGDENHVMQAKGKFIAQADHGSTANVTINR